VPAFYRSNSSPKWAVRYTPRAAGTHQVTLQVTDANGTGQSSGYSFTAGAASNSRGFMGVTGNRITDSYGKQLTVLGTNYAWGAVDEILNAMPTYKANQMNLMRVWLSCWWANYALEWGPGSTTQAGITMTYEGIGRYNMDNAARFDTLMETAEANDIYIMLTMNSFGDFYYDWEYNAYNIANGGPSYWTDNNTDFWTNPTAIDYQKQLLRYIFARWGYSTSLGMLEYWNESDNHVNTYEHKPFWHEAVDTYWKSLDFYNHPTTTSFAWMDHIEFNQTSWEPLTTLDIVNLHFYHSANDAVDVWEDNIKRSLADFGNRPTFIGETGLDANVPKSAPITHRFVHDGVWSPMFRAGATGANLTWVVDQHPTKSGFDLPDEYKTYYNVFAGFITPAEYYLPSMPHVDYGEQSNGVKVGAFKNADRALLWLNDAQSHYGVAEPRTVSGMSFTLPSMNNGTYTVKYVNTVTGQTVQSTTATASGGSLTLGGIPSFVRDIAVKVVRQGSGTADTTAPSAPSNVTAPAKTDSTITLAWDASSDNIGVAEYRVTRNGSLVATVNGGTTYTDSGLTPNTAYTYTILAKDEAGNTSAASAPLAVSTNPIDTIPPTAPSGLTAASKSDTGVALSWTASTDNVGVTAYEILRGTQTIATVDGSKTTYADSGLAPNTSYTYAVKAKDARGNVSAPATTSVTTFASSANFLANPGFETAGGDGRPANWTCEQIWYCYTDTAVKRSGNASMKVDGATYAWFGSHQSVPAAPNQAYTLDGYVNIGRNAATTVRVNLQFLDSESKVVAEQNVATLTGTTTGWVNVHGTTTSPANAKFVRAHIHYASLDVTLHLDDFSLTKASADTTAPSAPTGLVSTAATDTSIDLYWNPSTDNYSVTGYDIYRNGAFAGSTFGGTTTWFTDSSLTPGTAYTYTVKAKDGAGNVSGASNAVVATTTGGSSDTQAPTAPTGLQSPSKTANSVTLSWTASTDNVGVAAYDLYRGSTLAGSTNGATTTYTDSGLTAGTTYTYTVKARDAAGNASAASAAVSVTTTAATSNLLANPGFELDNGSGVPASWTCEQNYCTRNTAVKRSGDASLKVDNTTGAWFGIYQGVAGTAGTTYDLAGYVNIPRNSGTNIVVKTQFLNGSGGVISEHTAAGFNGTTTNGWTLVQGSNAAPAGTANVRALVYIYGLNAELYLDDFSLSASSGGSGDTTAPSAPTNVASPSKTASAVTLTWTASTDNVGVTAYEVYRGSTLAGTTNGATTTFTDTGLTANTAYSYTVVAKDAAGNASPASAALSVTTSSANLLANGGFETANGSGGAASWTCDQHYCTRDTSVARSGAASAKVDGNSGAWFGYHQAVAANAGTAYTLDGYVNIGRNSGTLVQVKLQFVNGSGSVLAETTLASYNGTTTSGWTNVNGSLTAPAGTAQAKATFYFQQLDATVNLDDFSLTAN
jgi:chitodextrinase